MLAARVGRDGERLVADWIGRARLSVKRDGTDLTFDPQSDADPDEVEKLRRGAVPLLLAHLGGKIPLHASAVALEGRAIVLVGGSDRGKSTLAAALCDQLGASLLGDDAVVIERRADASHVVALEESHWLDVASARALGRPADFVDKRPHAPRRIDVKSAPLAMIVHLEFSTIDEPARLVPVAGLEAIAGLLAQLTRFLVDDREVARRDLTALAELIDHTRVARLERPRRLDLLRHTAALVAAAANGDPS
jgi:hypothetical protein